MTLLCHREGIRHLRAGGQVRGRVLFFTMLAVGDPGARGPLHLDRRVGASLHEEDKLMLVPNILPRDHHREGLARASIDRDVQLDLPQAGLAVIPPFFPQPLPVIAYLDAGGINGDRGGPA